MRWNGATVVCQRGFRPLVTPFNAEQSRIVNMLRARGAARMPPDRPLPEADIQLVEKWIRNGAYYRELGHDAGAEDGGPTVVVVTCGAPSRRCGRRRRRRGGRGRGRELVHRSRNIVKAARRSCAPASLLLLGICPVFVVVAPRGDAGLSPHD